MARQRNRTRQIALTALACLAGTAALVLTLGSSAAFAAAEPPVLKPITFTEPTHLSQASPRNAVQELKVDAEKGTYTLAVETAICSLETPTTTPIKYDATSEEVRAALEKTPCFETYEGVVHNPPVVTGGPGGRGGGTPYVVEFAGSINGAKPVKLMKADTKELDGTATVTNKVVGADEALVWLEAVDTGGTTDGSTVTIEDTLPAGLTPTKIKGVDMFLAPGEIKQGEEEGGGPGEMECTPKPETEPLKCTISGAEIITGDTLSVVIHVKVSSSAVTGENKMTVSGGGAEPATENMPLTVSNTPAAYGPAPDSVIAALSNNQAGAHASLTTAFTLNTTEVNEVAGKVKDIRFDLPPGLVGNVTQLPKCSIEKILEQQEFYNYHGQQYCPPGSWVGMVTLTFHLFEGPSLVRKEPLYAITPAPGEPVAFAFDALILPVRLDTSVLSGGDYGVRVTAPSLNETAFTFATSITVWGVPAEHNGPSPNEAVIRQTRTGAQFGGPNSGEDSLPLLTNPQQCGQSMSVAMETDSWEQQGNFGGEHEQTTTIPPLIGCEALTMQPSFTMLPDTLEAGAPAGYTLDLTVPQNLEPEALATPTVKNLKLALPVGTVVSPGVAWGLKTCSAGQFGLHSGQLANCPREAQVGEVEIETPNLPEKTLTGQVFLASPECSHFGAQELCTPENAENGEMVKLYVQAISLGESKTLVKLEGKGSINQATGQLTTTFENSPPLPFNQLRLKLGGGPRAALANPRRCGPATTTIDITPWSSPFTEDSAPFDTFDIDQNCFGPKFDPTVTPGMASIQSGEYSPFTLVFGREDDEGFLAGLQQVLPPGLLGKVGGIPLCQEPQASEGTCEPGSEIGTVQALTGAGADPFLVTDGKVFLTGHYKGAPFGLSIVVPAVAGPYTLAGTNGKGDVVVRAAINVDKEDAHLTITADPLPTELDGVPLQLKVLDVTISRKEFTFNPTSCERLHIQTTLTSQEGASATIDTPFQVTNCVGLGFNPKFVVTTSAHTSREDGASLVARLIYPLGPKLANVKNVRVELPKQLPSRLTTLQQACPDHTFAENPEKCPAASRIGQAQASTPILPNKLEGWAYFVSHGGAAFPNLVVVLQDRPDGVRVDLVGETFISKAGITSTTFGTVPDVPISEFELYLPEGKDSALAANGNLCRTALKMPTVFNGQNGGVLNQDTPIGVTGCPKAAKAKRARRARRARAASRHHHKKRHKKTQAKGAGQSRGK